MKILYCEKSLPGAPDGVVTLLTDSSVSRNNRPLFLPPHHDRWVMTVAPAIRVSRLGKFVSEKFAPRYYNAWTLVARLRPVGLTLPASATDTAFDSSIVIGDWIEGELGEGDIAVGGDRSANVLFDLSEVNAEVARLSSYFMIKHGDVIVPFGAGITFEPCMDSKVELTFNGRPCLNFKIK